MSVLFYRPSDLIDPDYVETEDEKAVIDNIPYYDTLCDNINDSLRVMINDKLMNVHIVTVNKDDVERNKHLGLIAKVLIADGWSCYREIVGNDFILYVRNPFVNKGLDGMETVVDNLE